jgi:hypothetical protein
MMKAGLRMTIPKYISIYNHPAHRNLRARISPQDKKIHRGGSYKDCLCLFKLNFNRDGSIATPTVANAKVLPG